jgi:hypothetical protein
MFDAAHARHPRLRGWRHCEVAPRVIGRRFRMPLETVFPKIFLLLLNTEYFSDGNSCIALSAHFLRRVKLMSFLCLMYRPGVRDCRNHFFTLSDFG